MPNKLMQKSGKCVKLTMEIPVNKSYGIKTDIVYEEYNDDDGKTWIKGAAQKYVKLNWHEFEYTDEQPGQRARQ